MGLGFRTGAEESAPFLFSFFFFNHHQNIKIMILKSINDWNKSTTIKFSSIKELKALIEAFTLIFGTPAITFKPSANFKQYVRFSDGDGYYSESYSHSICDESDWSIGTKYIIQKSMGYKWEVLGECSAELQPIETDYSRGFSSRGKNPF